MRRFLPAFHLDVSAARLDASTAYPDVSTTHLDASAAYLEVSTTHLDVTTVHLHVFALSSCCNFYCQHDPFFHRAHQHFT